MAALKYKNNYEFRKWAWRKNSKNDLPTIIINADYIPGTNKIYDSYLYRTNKNNIYRTNMNRDLTDMEFYIDMFNKTHDDLYMNMYYVTIEHYTELLNKYNREYPKYDNYIIYLVKDKKYIYSRDWE